ncbi:class I SAM-dependent methyltransferase [Euzebyella marina]|uniref:Class I SAM-dependent methyltransferase n=1 Tax=Euzebyella marina TaxID=1761453 RepID=A0A3G2L3N7_9FLAO|nr:class I SAM-dependent methyltransferase [Euzebyella marina]AYN66833.1 class I SAM-dependent methyltransferase [Euzebyella marina]
MSKNQKRQLISNKIESFYNEASEETRLEKGMGIFEFERIKDLITKYLESREQTIIDVGGGTGKYSEWLAELNHQLYLIEPVPKHLKLANKRAKKLENPFTVISGESRKLDIKNGFADMVILHGPLYHLQKHEDRIQTIMEAKRVLKPGGIILGFAINYTASTLVGLLNGFIHDQSFFKMCKEELTKSIHNPPKNFPGLLAEAYYHRPDELKKEFSSADLKFLNLHAVEGMAWLDKDYFSSMLHGKNKKTLQELVAITENDEYLLPFSPHMMIAVQKN